MNEKAGSVLDGNQHNGESMVSHRQNRLTVYVAASLIAIGLTIASFNTIAAESKKLQQREVPEAVLHAFKSTYPSGRVGAYVREVRDGKTVYELETIEKSVRRDIIYSESGEVLELKSRSHPACCPRP